MFKSRFSFVLAIVACLALPATGLAVPAGAQLTALDEAAGAVAVPHAGVAPAAAAPQVVYLVQPAQAAAAPAESTSALAGLAGALGSVGGWAAIVGALALVIFSIWKGGKADAAKMAVIRAAESSWYIAEAIGGDGAQKYQLACAKFLQMLGVQDLSADAKALALRDQTFETMSSADKVARQRTPVAAADARPQMPLAAS